MSFAGPSGGTQNAGSSSNANATPRLPAENYTLGWICALPVELRAARTFFDVEHGPLVSRPKHDENIYSLGQIGGHNVVMVCPSEYGGTKAAVAASRMQATFPNVRFSLMVGIGGGIPNSSLDIRLGDIVVSFPSEQGPGVIQYDLGRVTVSEFVRKCTLSKPPGLLLQAVNDLRSRSGVAKGLAEMLEKAPQIEDEEGDLYGQAYPSDLKDTLFRPEYEHIKSDPPCECERENKEHTDNAITRKKRNHQNPRIHYGNIASGSAVMKNARERDALAKRDNVICFEMEAFGLMDDFQCLVIRGICDYSDSHKNKEWQPYASSVAAAYAKRLLHVVPPEEVAKLKPVRNNVHWIGLSPVNPCFTGRKTILQTLRESLCYDNENTEQSAHRTFVIYGVGGAGKSEVCLKFAHENRENFWGVFWVDASSIDSIRRSFIKIVEEAGGEKGIEYDTARSWIENRPENWLLIFDNADDPSIDYHKYLPSGNGGCILLTTRNETCKIYGSESAGYEKFEKLDFDDAMELLLKSAGVANSPENREISQSLVGEECLAQHALSIVQAGAFIRKGLCKLEEYANMFQTQRLMLLKSHPDQASSVYRDVYATFEVSATAIRASSRKESRDALELLKVLAYLHRDAVLEGLFTRAWKHSLNPRRILNDPEDSIRHLCQWHVDHLRQFLHPVSSTEELDLLSFRNARQVLLSFSLINVHPDTYEISMHPLVHTWARDRLVVEEQHDAWAIAAATLSLSIDSYSYQEYFNNLQPHIEFSLSMFHEESLPIAKWSTLEICRIFHRYAWVFVRQCQDTGLKDILHLISSLECPEILPDSLNWRHVLHIYSLCQRGLGNHEKELRLIEVVVAFDKRVMDPTDEDRLLSQRSLGVTQICLGKYQEAIKVLQDVVKIRQKIRSPDDKELLTSKHELAAAYRFNKQSEEAIGLLKEVVQIRQETLASTHPERLASEHELASAYINNQQPEQAIQLLEEIIRIKQGILAPTHPERLVSEHGLASAYTNNQQPEQAIQLLEEVVRIRQGILAPTHTNRLTSEHELARAYYEMGKYQKALPIIKEVVRIEAGIPSLGHQSRILSEELLENCISKIKRQRVESEIQPEQGEGADSHNSTPVEQPEDS